VSDGAPLPDVAAGAGGGAPSGARVAGHCVVCSAMVERRPDGSCPAGHAPEAVAGRIELADGEPLPAFPGFNWGAFLIPPIWGVAHGLWAGVFFLPLWAFVDNAIRGTADAALWMRAVAWLTFAGTLAFQVEYARVANRLAWRRACDRMSLAAYVRRQHIWAAFGAVTLCVIALWIALYLLR
jgi:hypothetical protein